MQLQIKIESNLLKQINAFRVKFPDACDEVVRDTAAETMKKIMEATPVQTGNARRNWLLRKIKNTVWEIYNKVPYVPHLEYGTKAHGATRSEYLHFPIMQGNSIVRWVRKKKVRGIRAKRMVRDNIDFALDTLRIKMKEKINLLWNNSRR